MTLNRNHSKRACFQTLENNVASCTPASCCVYLSGLHLLMRLLKAVLCPACVWQDFAELHFRERKSVFLKDDARHIPLVFLQCFVYFLHSRTLCCSLVFKKKKKKMLTVTTSYSCCLITHVAYATNHISLPLALN